jgi:hypothetical protein
VELDATVMPVQQLDRLRWRRRRRAIAELDTLHSRAGPT